LHQRRERVEVNSPLKDHREFADRSGKEVVDSRVQINKKVTFVRKLRQEREKRSVDLYHLPLNNNRKRGTNQVWVQVPVRVVGEGSSESAGKRGCTATVFDRLEDGIAGPLSVFDRLESPLADPRRQGRREQ
jgi:hypothetical protein